MISSVTQDLGDDSDIEIERRRGRGGDERSNSDMENRTTWK